jgi:hypothetical protein
MSRFTALLATLFLATATGAEAQGPPTYSQTFGLSSPITATGNNVIATYFGWEASTVFGHEVYALTTNQYATNLGAGCFSFYSIYRTGCQDAGNVDLGALLGLGLFGKQFGVTCAVPDPTVDRCLVNPITQTFSWIPGTEIIFGLSVDLGIDPELGTHDYAWFFSGDPSRNPDDLAHLAFFPTNVYPGGVPGNRGVGTVPQTAGLSLFGFEDTYYANSDWDFDNSIFALDNNTISIPTDVVPEPGTLAMLAAGVTSLAAAGMRRRRRTSPA